MSTDMRTRAAGVLEQTEKDLRKLLKETFDGAPYEDILWLTRLAEQVHNLVPAARLPGTGVGGERPASGPGVAAPRGSAGSRRRSDYPKFEIRNDVLIKTGWSKKQRKEYVHKAPVAVLDAVKARIAEVAKARPTFTMEDVMPVPAPDGNGEVPSYQVYMCVAHLITGGGLCKHGKDGYEVC